MIQKWWSLHSVANGHVTSRMEACETKSCLEKMGIVMGCSLSGDNLWFPFLFLFPSLLSIVFPFSSFSIHSLLLLLVIVMTQTLLIISKLYVFWLYTKTLHYPCYPFISNYISHSILPIVNPQSPTTGPCPISILILQYEYLPILYLFPQSEIKP